MVVSGTVLGIVVEIVDDVGTIVVTTGVVDSVVGDATVDDIIIGEACSEFCCIPGRKMNRSIFIAN